MASFGSCASSITCFWVMHSCWHLKYFLCHPRPIIGFNSAYFCSITRWIVSMALGKQATVYTLLSYNFFCMVMMLNGKGLHGSAPKVKTVTRALNGWWMSGGKEAGELYLAAAFPSKSSRTGFDISHRLETKMTGSVSFCKRRPRGRCGNGVVFCLSVPTETGSHNYKLPHNSIAIWIIFFAVRGALYCDFSPLSYFDMTQDHCCPVSPPSHSSALKIHGESFVLPSMATAVIRVSPGVTKLSLLRWTFLQSWHHCSYFCSLFIFLSCSMPEISVLTSAEKISSILAATWQCSGAAGWKVRGWSGNGFECRSRVAHMWGIFSLFIQEIVEEQQPRGGVLAPVAAEGESLVRFNLVFSVFIIRARRGPLRGGAASICFDGMNHSCLPGTSLKKCDLRLLSSIFKIDECVFLQPTSVLHTLLKSVKSGLSDLFILSLAIIFWSITSASTHTCSSVCRNTPWTGTWSCYDKCARCDKWRW